MPRREALLPAAAAAHAGLFSGGDLPMGTGNADLDDQYVSIYVFIYVSVCFSITYIYIIHILYIICKYMYVCIHIYIYIR